MRCGGCEQQASALVRVRAEFVFANSLLPARVHTRARIALGLRWRLRCKLCETDVSLALPCCTPHWCMHFTAMSIVHCLTLSMAVLSFTFVKSVSFCNVCIRRLGQLDDQSPWGQTHGPWRGRPAALPPPPQAREVTARTTARDSTTALFQSRTRCWLVVALTITMLTAVEPPSRPPQQPSGAQWLRLRFVCFASTVNRPRRFSPSEWPLQSIQPRLATSVFILTVGLVSFGLTNGLHVGG